MILRLGPLLLALDLVVGCGAGSGNTAHLSGKVTLNGEAIPEGSRASVTFRPSDPKGKAVTVPIVDGMYDSPKTPKGTAKTSFEIMVPTGKKLKSNRTGEFYDETQNVTPQRYQQGVEVDVTEDNLAHDFNLE